MKVFFRLHRPFTATDLWTTRLITLPFSLYFFSFETKQRRNYRFDKYNNSRNIQRDVTIWYNILKMLLLHFWIASHWTNQWASYRYCRYIRQSLTWINASVPQSVYRFPSLQACACSVIWYASPWLPCPILAPSHTLILLTSFPLSSVKPTAGS